MKTRRVEIDKETNTSAAWYLQIWGYLSGANEGIRNGLSAIPEDYYPDNPAKENFLPDIFTRYVLPFLSPIALLSGWAGVWTSIKNYYNAKNKNAEKTLDLAINIVTTAASTTFLGMVLLGGGGLAIYAAPYVLAAALGLGTAYGVFNVVKHAYRACRAHKEKNIEKRNQHLWAIPLQLVSTAINALGFITNLVLNVQVVPKLNDAFTIFQTSLQNFDLSGLLQAMGMTQSAGTLFAGAKSLLYGLGALVTLGTVGVAFKQNAEAFEAIKHPILSLKKAGNVIQEKSKQLWSFVKKTHYIGLPLIVIPIALSVVGVAVNVLSRVVSLALTPLQGIGYGVLKLFGRKNKAPILAPALPVSLSSTTQIASRLEWQDDYENLQALVDVKHQELARQPSTKKNLSKLYFMQEVREKLGANAEKYDVSVPVETIEEKAKNISSRLYQSFWREEGEVQKISRLAKEMDQKIRLAKS